MTRETIGGKKEKKLVKRHPKRGKLERAQRNETHIYSNNIFASRRRKKREEKSRSGASKSEEKEDTHYQLKRGETEKTTIAENGQ